jgi:hypothetical protein
LKKVRNAAVMQLFYKSITCIGVLDEDSFVNPTISEKYMDTDSNISGRTLLPHFNWSATTLQGNEKKQNHIIRTVERIPTEFYCIIVVCY